MRVFAISDLHLSFSGQKPMSVFGPCWDNHAQRVEKEWRSEVSERDIVCLAGDFSWATKLPEVLPELEWLGSLPGRKVLIKGNHDYWWPSISKLRSALPEGVFALQHDSVIIDGIGFAGARGWVDPSLDLTPLYPARKDESGDIFYSILGEEEDKKHYDREVERLRMSLASLRGETRLRIALLHFPPASPAMEPTKVTELLEEFGVDHAVFGHLHLSGESGFKNPYGKRNNVTYHLTSADFIGFTPALIAEVDS
ncbi:phosphohydrolase [bacterium]|nr:MAG: phosphohydrolase [bacterium]